MVYCEWNTSGVLWSSVSGTPQASYDLTRPGCNSSVRSYSEQHDPHVSPAFSDSSFGLVPLYKRYQWEPLWERDCLTAEPFLGELGMDHC